MEMQAVRRKLQVQYGGKIVVRVFFFSNLRSVLEA